VPARNYAEAFRALIGRCPFSVAIVEDGRYVFVNQTWAWALGRDADALAGEPVRCASDEARRSVLALARPATCTFESASGDVVVLDLTPLSLEGSKLVLIATNVEERKVQADLLLNDRLMSIGALASGVAHEINNPLSYVLGNVDFLEEELPKNVADGPVRVQIAEALGQIHEGAERVRTIVRNLQAFARADQIGTRPIDLNATIDAVVAMAWVEIRHRARLVRSLAPKLPAVKATEARIGQVVLNLLLNAAHVLPEGRADANRIAIETSYDPESSRVKLAISDTGPGIPADVIDSVFDPYFAVRPRGVGAGLGLSIVHTIVTALGGGVTVASEIGKGATYTVTLPIADDASVIQAEGDPPPADVVGRILVIDDEPLIASAISRALRRHEVSVVEDGRHAIEILSGDRQFDIILCDLMMPDLTGMDVYRWVADHRPGLERRFVFMTGGTFTPKSQAFLDSVSNDRISKPFDFARFRKLVDFMLRQRAGATPSAVGT
jgi:signal transduction histidine kinase